MHGTSGEETEAKTATVRSDFRILIIRFGLFLMPPDYGVPPVRLGNSRTGVDLYHLPTGEQVGLHTQWDSKERV